jgi:hypothetical protein
MKRLAGALALLALVAADPSPAGAESGALPRQLGYLGIGVPVPLVLYDYDPSLEGSGASVDLLLHGRLSWAHAVLERPLLLVGLRLSASGMKASNEGVAAAGYIAAFGPELSMRLPLGKRPDPRWGAGLGLGPTFVFAGFRVDENMEERTTAFGLQAHLWLDCGIVSWLRVALDVAVEHAFDPLGGETFFNEPLGSNTILCLTLGPMALF